MSSFGRSHVDVESRRCVRQDVVCTTRHTRHSTLLNHDSLSLPRQTSVPHVTLSTACFSTTTLFLYHVKHQYHTSHSEYRTSQPHLSFFTTSNISTTRHTRHGALLNHDSLSLPRHTSVPHVTPGTACFSTTTLFLYHVKHQYHTSH